MRTIPVVFVKLIYRLVRPVARHKDVARREFILHILLLGAICLSLVGFVLNCLTYCGKFSSSASLPPVLFVFFLVFVGLFILSKKKHSFWSAVIFVSILLVASLQTAFRWGADVPQVLLMFALIIVISGILISTKWAFLMTSLVGISLIILTYLDLQKMYVPDTYWKNELLTMGDTIVAVVTLSIIAVVSWLSNREMENALRRARNSESALLKERDQLEITVQKRTEELKRAQLEKMVQLYRFAEFGRLSSGLFHDLITPLNLVSLNLETLYFESKESHKQELVAMRKYVRRAIYGTKRLETFINAARKQLQENQVMSYFSPIKEIEQIIQLLSYQARENYIRIQFFPNKQIKMYGNALKFSQLVTNLVTNAIDACRERSRKEGREITVGLQVEGTAVCLRVQDNGKGIAQSQLQHIFSPFFSTKHTDKNMGLGLFITKDIVEKDFLGTISVETTEDTGTTFSIRLPLRKIRSVKSQ
jgi:signal transduction histidine kinase